MDDDARRIWTVGELAAAVKSKLETTFPDVLVQGEVGMLSAPSSGHVYFTLKDDQAALRCVLYRHIRRYLRFLPEAGQEVIVRGKVSSYGPRSEYQVIVDHIEPLGLGSLYAAFLQRQKELAAKGYFALERKRPLPFLPATIGIVTSLTGAALHDMLRIIYARQPGRHVVIAPTLVQGEGAAVSIARAIRLLNEYVEPDVIIVGRGGGSAEDLWAWNEEEVVRAVVESRAPVVSGVGHEIDTSLCDLAADVRAATPTHAAELVVPKADDLLFTINRQLLRLRQAMVRRRQLARLELNSLRQRLAHEATPTALPARRLDDLRATLRQAMLHLARENAHRVALLAQRLRGLSPQNGVRQQRRQADYALSRLRHNGRTIIRLRRQRLDALQARLEALSPLAVLSRGYAIVLGEDGHALTRAAEARHDERLDIRLHEGRLTAKVETVD